MLQQECNRNVALVKTWKTRALTRAGCRSGATLVTGSGQARGVLINSRGMANPEPDAQESERRKRTIWLLIGGAASLLLPLLGALYLRWSEDAAPPSAGSRQDVFQHRGQDNSKIVPTRNVVVPPVVQSPPVSAPALDSRPPAESSLDFIKPAAELEPKPPSAKAAAAPPAPEAPAARTAAAPAPKKAAQTGPKAFVMPKLQPSRGFTQFGTTGAGGGQAAPAGQGGQGGQNIQDLLKNLTPAQRNNPQIQKYLQEHSQGQ